MVKQSKSTRNASEANTDKPSKQRIVYTSPIAAKLLGVNYFSVYRLVQRGKLKACRVLRGKFLITKAELFRLLESE